MPVVEATVVSLVLGRGPPLAPSRADRYCDGLILPSKGFPQALLFVRLPGPIAARLFLTYMRSAKLQGLWPLSSCSRMMWSQPVRQAPVEPGRQKMAVPLASPPNARDCIVELPISVKENLPEQFAEALDFDIEQRRDRLAGIVAGGEAGASRRPVCLVLPGRRSTARPARATDKRRP